MIADDNNPVPTEGKMILLSRYIHFNFNSIASNKSRQNNHSHQNNREHHNLHYIKIILIIHSFT